jgi:serine/threonine protein kinase
MALGPGVTLGHYEVVASLGAGGMGEVWRARDTRLGREVALKVLPPAFASDPERMSRFGREARVLASLNHPHIGAIYGLEDADGVTALVLELIEGPTLADRIAPGPMPVDEALPIARQIAAALEAAHEQGIVHRDLKPANVKVKADGTVKVLDFGLAKALQPQVGSAAGEPTHSPTVTAPTQKGVILGTAAYMAPEQARGAPVDRRADVWAFGCVLFEMLAGRRPFVGADVTDTLAAVLRSEPVWESLPASTPPPILKLLRRCLQKTAANRLRDIGDARLEIEDAIAGLSVTTETRAVATAPAQTAGRRLRADRLGGGRALSTGDSD